MEFTCKGELLFHGAEAVVFLCPPRIRKLDDSNTNPDNTEPQLSHTASHIGNTTNFHKEATSKLAKDHPEDDVPFNVRYITKIRPSKPYRFPPLDQSLRKKRTMAEYRMLKRCAGLNGVRVPRIYSVDRTNWAIHMEFIEGQPLREWLALAESQLYMSFIQTQNIEFDTKSTSFTLGTAEALYAQMKLLHDQSFKDIPPSQKKDLTSLFCTYHSYSIFLCHTLGRVIGQFHLHNIVHGDLTTSNVLVCTSNARINEQEGLQKSSSMFENGNDPLTATSTSNCPLGVIDFGLSCVTHKAEDRAVDLFVFEKALSASHRRSPEWLPVFYEGYREVSLSFPTDASSSDKYQQTMTRLENVRLRGRKRSMVG